MFVILCPLPNASVHLSQWNVIGIPLVDPVYTGIPLGDPVYTGIPLGDPANTCRVQRTLEHHLKNLVEIVPRWNTTGETLTISTYTVYCSLHSDSTGQTTLEPHWLTLSPSCLPVGIQSPFALLEHNGRPMEPQVHLDATGTTLADAST